MANLISKIYITSEFEKAFARFPMNIQNLAIKKDALFCKDPFNSTLNTHKLKGPLKGYWSYSINYKYRILFRFLGKNEVIYYDVGTHGIYK